MKKVIVPAIIMARLKTKTPQQVASDLGYTVEQVKACAAQCDPKIMHGIPLTDLILPEAPPKRKADPDAIRKLLPTHTHEEISKLLNISTRTISRYVKELDVNINKPVSPSMAELFENRTLKELSEFTGVPLDRLKIILK